MTEKLEDRWHARDFPVLLETARLLDSGHSRVRASEAADGERISIEAAELAFAALSPTYLEVFEAEGRLSQARGDLIAVGVTERGRRAVGLWPSGESTDALVDALRQAEEVTDDPEEKTLIRRAAGALGSVSREVMADVIAAFVRQQAGL